MGDLGADATERDPHLRHRPPLFRILVAWLGVGLALVLSDAVLPSLRSPGGQPA
jgi:hypothetical protein